MKIFQDEAFLNMEYHLFHGVSALIKLGKVTLTNDTFVETDIFI